MILPDINLLLYAYNPHTPQHRLASRWWEATLRGDELVGLPPEVMFGFVRIATHAGLGAAAVPLPDARRVVEGWLEAPPVRSLTPDAGHVGRVFDLLQAVSGSGALVSDAVLASYAIHNRAVVHTNDADFGRFPGVLWSNPLRPQSSRGARRARKGG